jgi:hypothetical protein
LSGTLGNDAIQGKVGGLRMSDHDYNDAGIPRSTVFFLGALAGAVFATLFAPYEGRRTRKLLRRRFRHGVERGRELREDIAERGRELREDAGEFVEDKKEALERGKEKLTAAFSGRR